MLNILTETIQNSSLQPGAFQLTELIIPVTVNSHFCLYLFFKEFLSAALLLSSPDVHKQRRQPGALRLPQRPVPEGLHQAAAPVPQDHTQLEEKPPGCQVSI